MLERSDYGLIAIAAIVALAVLDRVAFRRHASTIVALNTRYLLLFAGAIVLVLIAVAGIFRSLGDHPTGLYLALILLVMALVGRIRIVYTHQKQRE